MNRRNNCEATRLFIGQNVGVSSKSKGILTGTILSLFETKDVETSQSIWCAVVNTEQLDQTVEVPISRLLGVLK